MDANNVWGSVGIQNQVVCNGASVSTDPILTAVNSNQECHAKDPYSGISAYVTNVAGNAVFQGSAMGNSFQADSNAPNFPVITRQINNSANDLQHGTSAPSMSAARVGMSSSAIGNTSQIIHYNTQRSLIPDCSGILRGKIRNSRAGTGARTSPVPFSFAACA